MIKQSVFIVLLVMVLTAPTVLAHQPLTTQDALPVAVHKVKFETGLHYLNYQGGGEAFQVATELNYGLINNLDLGLEVPFVFYSPDQGDNVDVIGDVIIKSKLLFLKGREGNPITLTFQPFLKLPTADKNEYPGSTGEPDIGFVLIGTRNLRPLMAHLNVGYIFVGNPANESYDDVFLFKVALEYLADPQFQMMGELTAETNRAANADDAFAFLLGGRYLWLKDVSLDTGFSVGLSNSSPDYRAMFGITMNF